MKRLGRSDSHARDTKLGRVASKLGANLLLGILLLGLSTTGQVANAQKSGGSSTPVLPNVRYTLTKLGPVSGFQTVWVSAPNGMGDGVGTASAGIGSPPGTALAYHSGTGGSPVIFDLNGLSAPWYDLNEMVLPGNVPTPVLGWKAPRAFGLNVAGDIVGYAENTVNPSLPLRAYLLENAFGTAPRFLLLPTVAAVSHLANGINNSGEIVVQVTGLGVYRYKRLAPFVWPYYVVPASAAIPGNIGGGKINDVGAIIAQAGDLPVGKFGSYRQQLDGQPPEYFSGYLFTALSNSYIGGSRDIIGKVKGGAFRMPELGAASSAQIIFSGSIGNYVRDINDYGDLCFESTGRVFLYTDAINPDTKIKYGTNGNGILPLDQMVDYPTDADWLNNTSYIRFTGISSRDLTIGFGQICVVNFGSNRGFLLTPHTIPPPN